MSEPHTKRHRPPRHESQLSPTLKRHVKWARKWRSWLIAELGGKCVDCGTTDELEFDELLPRPPGMPAPNRTSRWQRLRNYLKLHKRGLIALRCRVCNSKRGEPSHDTLPHGASDAPF